MLKLTPKQKTVLWLARLYGIKAEQRKLVAQDPKQTIVNRKSFNSIFHLMIVVDGLYRDKSDFESIGE